MTRKRASMRKIREVLRLKLELKLSDRLIGQSVQLARSTVQDYVARAQQAGLSWPLPPELDDVQLEVLLFRTREQAAVSVTHQPDWAAIDRELRRKGVTRQLLWEEYRRHHPDGWQYATEGAPIAVPADLQKSAYLSPPVRGGRIRSGSVHRARYAA
ncbi:hypothetical protein [Deinococcus sp. NW-56]|uniref:hypothetical protein n=1 Tax=Deinococcus sp. NW-56 TaxID=2080419 RepID=UPI00131A2D2B|nr:hypothetical protein [Deinococcus sp. NW-56]